MNHFIHAQTGVSTRSRTGRTALALVATALWLLTPAAHAQWITQANSLKAGWNSVYLHVDASHTNANSLLVANPNIQEAWLWTADLPPGLSLATPPNPTPSSQWVKWTRIDGANSPLLTLPGNAALLVRVADGVAPFTWNVKGRPVLPNYRWSLTGLNFVGFPVASPVPTFETFLAPDAQTLDWKQSAELFRYQGGVLGATNPIQVSANLQRAVTVARDQAYWIRAGEPDSQLYNRYFGPFQVTGADSKGLRFGDSKGQTRLMLRNMTDASLTVSLRAIASESPPVGSAPLSLPLMVRGPLNPTDLSFGYFSLTAGPTNIALAAHGEVGSEVEIILGVDRASMGTAAGTEYASVLRFTDSLGLSRVEVGASASVPSRAGLWVGSASVDKVGQYLKSYVKATNAAHFHHLLNQKNLAVGTNAAGTNIFGWATNANGAIRYERDAASGLVLVFTQNTDGTRTGGHFLQDGPVNTDLTSVAQPAPLRLIVHHDGATTRLLQRAYVGTQPSTSNQVVALRQAALATDANGQQLPDARRISAVHLPSAEPNAWWELQGGSMNAGSTLTAVVDMGFDSQSSNPFVHTYHPDHDNIDNRDDTFVRRLGTGKESYDVRRTLSLAFTSPGADFDSRTRTGTQLTGTYSEVIAIRAGTVDLRQFNVVGTFALGRIAETSILLP